MKKRFGRKLFGSLAVAGAVLGSALVLGAPARAAEITIVAVTHGQASDPFWSIVKNGMMQAAEDQKVRVDYRAPETFDMVAMGQLIDAAVNQQPAGLIVSVPDADALGPSIKKAVAAGIPVISINAGGPAAHAMGARLHVGQDELSGGRIVGAHLAELGVKHVLCVNHEVGNASLDQRCQGVTEGLKGKVTVLPTSTDPVETQAKIRAALSSDSSIDCVLSLNAALVGEPAVTAVESLGMQAKVKVASYDLSSGFLKDVAAGKAIFAVDQQPYLQGYLPVTFLAQYAKNGTLPAGDVSTGPSFITKETAGQAIEMSAKGIR